MSIPIEVLARVRHAIGRLAPVSYPGDPIPPFAPTPESTDRVTVLRDRLRELRAPGDSAEPLVEVPDPAAFIAAVVRFAAGIPPEEIVFDDPRTPRRFARLGVTPAYAVIADTGSVILDLPTAETGYASLLVEHHVVVAGRAQLRPDLTTFYSELAVDRSAGRLGGYQVCITGCSRTADIEKRLVVPAHGPKRLTLLLSAVSFEWSAVRAAVANALQGG